MIILISVAVALLISTYLFLFRKEKKFPLTVKNYQKDKVYVFVFPCDRPDSIICNSPFCGKLLLYLKLREIPFEKRTDKFPGPREQLPYIELNGEIICDSDNIIQILDQHFPPKKEEKMIAISPSPMQSAIATSIQRIIEDSLYFRLVYFRWATKEGWSDIRIRFFKHMPIFIRWFIRIVARRSVKDRIYRQGTLRLSPEEIQNHVERDINALATFLGNQSFFFGTKQPTLVDIMVYATIHMFDSIYENCPLEVEMKKHENLIQFCDRMKLICFE